MEIRGFRASARLLAAVACALAGCSLPPAGYLASRAVVVVPDVFLEPRTAHSAAHWGGAAAEDLTNALALVTGGHVALLREGDALPENAPVIYVGDVRAAHEAGVADDTLRNLDFRVKTEGSRTFLWSKTATGAAYAVADFLSRQCGYHMLTFSGDDPYAENPLLRIAPCDYRERAAIYRHETYYGAIPAETHPKAARHWRDYSGFARRMRTRFREADIEGSLRVSRQTRACHSTFCYLPPEKYWKDHPEYYSMDKSGMRRCIPGGSVNCGQICYSNPDVRRICTESLLRFIGNDRKANPSDYPCVYDFTQQDGTGYLCLCPECKKVIAKYNRVEGGHREGGDMGLQLEFVNAVAKEVGARYPDVKIRIFAYVSTEAVPAGIVPAENVLVWLCDLYTLSDHMLPLTHPLNAERRKVIEDWAKAAPELELWDYMIDTRYVSRGRAIPEVNVDAISSDARFFRDCGIQRVFMENDFIEQPFYELNAYATGRCYWNPDCDIEALLDEYCLVYGKGARKMREAIDMLRAEIAARPPASASEWFERHLPWRNVKFYETFRRPVQAAYDLADRPVERARIAGVLAAVDDELSHLRGATTAADRELLRRDRENALRHRIEALTGEMEDGPARAKLSRKLEEEFVRRREIDELVFDQMPQGVSSNDCSAVCFDIRSISGSRIEKRTVADPAAWRGQAVELEDKVKPSSVDCGFYDRMTKDACNFSFSMPTGERDGRYRWYRVGRGRIGRDSIFRFGGWANHVSLHRCYLNADGAAEDPNVLDCWVSAAYAGGRIRVDRIVLKRKE